MCIDPKDLNRVLRRSHYPTPTIDEILPELSRAKVFSTVGAKNGFWHVELDNDSSRLTTFNSPFGRFRWLRLALGPCTAPEEFQRRLNHALEGLKGVRTIHNDILVFGEGYTEDEALEDHDRNHVEWFWTNLHDSAVLQLKRLVTNAPVFKYFDSTKGVTRQCNASDKGPGGAQWYDSRTDGPEPRSPLAAASQTSC